jgi:hypothetical protein
VRGVGDKGAAVNGYKLLVKVTVVSGMMVGAASALNLFTTHVEYLGLTPTEVADATTSTDGDLTYVDISNNINNFDAWISAVFEHGAAGSGLFESVLGSLQLYLTNTF